MQLSSEKELIFVFAVIVIILLFLIGYIIYFVFLYERRKLKNQQEKQQLFITFNQEIYKAQIEIQEQTFRNISQELHDNIGQVLTLVKLNMNTMDFQRPEQLREKIFDSRQLLTKAIQDIRSISKSLNTDYIKELGLGLVIKNELALVSRFGNYKTDFAIHGIEYPLDPQKQLIIFRIFQEAINNIVKHAKAARISVDIYYNQAEFKLEVVDDGDGFDIDTYKVLPTTSSNGIGLRNMESRAMLIGARLCIESTLRRGTKLVLVLFNS